MKNVHLDIPAGGTARYDFDKFYGSCAVLHEEGDDNVYITTDGTIPVIKGEGTLVVLPGSRRTVILRNNGTTSQTKPVIRFVAKSAATVEIEVATD